MIDSRVLLVIEFVAGNSTPRPPLPDHRCAEDGSAQIQHVTSFLYSEGGGDTFLIFLFLYFKFIKL